VFREKRRVQEKEDERGKSKGLCERGEKGKGKRQQCPKNSVEGKGMRGKVLDHKPRQGVNQNKAGL